MQNDADNVNRLILSLRQFARERDWDQFHSPKNLAMAMVVEAGELLEHFQWLTEAQSERLSAEKRQEVEYEIADVFIYLLRLSDKLEIDIVDAALRKIVINANKYPAEKVSGQAKKYTEYEGQNPNKIL